MEKEQRLQQPEPAQHFLPSSQEQNSETMSKQNFASLCKISMEVLDLEAKTFGEPVFNSKLYQSNDYGKYRQECLKETPDRVEEAIMLDYKMEWYNKNKTVSE